MAQRVERAADVCSSAVCGGDLCSDIPEINLLRAFWVCVFFITTSHVGNPLICGGQEELSATLARLREKMDRLKMIHSNSSDTVDYIKVTARKHLVLPLSMRPRRSRSVHLDTCSRSH